MIGWILDVRLGNFLGPLAVQVVLYCVVMMNACIHAWEWNPVCCVPASVDLWTWDLEVPRIDILMRIPRRTGEKGAPWFLDQLTLGEKERKEKSKTHVLTVLWSEDGMNQYIGLVMKRLCTLDALWILKREKQRMLAPKLEDLNR